MKNSNSEAWYAVFKGDLGALNQSLSDGANPNHVHPVAKHSLLSQAAKSPLKACEMSAILIDRGANVPSVEDPLAFELTWHAIVSDSVILAKKLMDVSASWASYFMCEKEKYVTSASTRLDMMVSAKAAFTAIDRFNREFAPHMQPAFERTPSISRVGM
jgi:hypothetical protein